MTYVADRQSRVDDLPKGHKKHNLASSWGSVMSKHALTLVLVVLVIYFTISLPGTFFTIDNIPPVLATQSVPALLALAVMVPLITNNFDLSVGYVLGFTSILAIGLQTKQGLSWQTAIAVTLVVGLVVGIVNGLLVTTLKVNSFIATLGTGSLAYALGLWYTGGQAVSGTIPPAFAKIGSVQSHIPVPAIYVIVVAVLAWILFEFTPIGRHFYVIGASTRTASLLKIRVETLSVASFAVSGLIASIGGIVLASQLQTAQSSTGPEYLLPAFAAVFLGSTAIRPGRVNVWGTIVAVLVLATLVTGLQQSGFAAWVQPLVNGIMVVGAVAIAGIVQRRKASASKKAEVDTRLADLEVPEDDAAKESPASRASRSR